MRVAAKDLIIEDLVKLVFAKAGKTIYGRVWSDDGDVFVIRAENEKIFDLLKADGSLDASSEIDLTESPEIYKIDLEDDKIDPDEELHGIVLDVALIAEDFADQSFGPVEFLSDDLQTGEIVNSDLAELEVGLRYGVAKLNKLLERVENLNNKRFNKN